MKSNTRIAAITTSALVLCVAAGAATAGTKFTTVNSAAPGEMGHATILSQIYGGSWSMSGNGRDYSGGSMSATRMDDIGSKATSLTSGVTGTDNSWVGPVITSVVAKAKYAGDNSVFGYYDDSGTDTSFHTIFNTSTFNSPVQLTMPTSFRWALKDMSTDMIFTSNASDNMGLSSYASTSYDQLVTYKVTGPNGLSEWALFWEDRVQGQAADYDYNDAVITITASPVPAPGAAVLGLAGMGLMARRRRK